MKTFTLILLISATIFGVSAYSQEPSGHLDSSSTINHTSAVARARVVVDPQSVKSTNPSSPRQSEKMDSQTAIEVVTLDPIRVEATELDVIGIYSSGDESYKSAFSVVGLPRS